MTTWLGLRAERMHDGCECDGWELDGSSRCRGVVGRGRKAFRAGEETKNEEGGAGWSRREQECPRHTRTCTRGRGRPRHTRSYGEAAFLAKASDLGFGVAKPWGDSDPYDFIVETGGRLWKVQVKSAHRAGEDGSYSFRAHGHSLRAYRADEIDALVAYVVPENAWYVFPVKVVRLLRSLKLFTGSRKRRSKFEKYREAWWILRGEGGS